MSDHVTIQMISGGYLLECLICSGAKMMRTPIPVEDATEMMDLFGDEHKNCTEGDGRAGCDELADAIESGRIPEDLVGLVQRLMDKVDALEDMVDATLDDALALQAILDGIEAEAHHGCPGCHNALQLIYDYRVLTEGVDDA